MTAPEDMEDLLRVRDSPAHLSSWFGAWLCPQGLCLPCEPSRHHCVGLHLQQHSEPSTQAVMASPGVPHVLALSWGRLQQRSAWSCCSTQHSSAHSWGCWGWEGRAGHCETRASPGHRWQVPAVLPAFLWDSGVHESGKSLSECRSTWWKGNL